MDSHVPDLTQMVDDLREYLEERVISQMDDHTYQRRAITTTVPYGSTTASFDNGVELSHGELEDAAQQAWEEGLIVNRQGGYHIR